MLGCRDVGSAKFARNKRPQLFGAGILNPVKLTRRTAF
jgi:hypothetical protein